MCINNYSNMCNINSIGLCNHHNFIGNCIIYSNLYNTYLHLCIPECKRERGTTRQQGGSVSQVRRGEWPGRWLHQQGLKDEEKIKILPRSFTIPKITYIKYSQV